MRLRRLAIDVGDWGTGIRDAASLERDRVNKVIDFDHNHRHTLSHTTPKGKRQKNDRAMECKMLVMR